MKHVVFLGILIASFSLQAIIYEGSIQNSHSVVFDLRHKNDQSDWDFFNTVVFRLPEIIKEVRYDNIPLYIIVPSRLDGFSPLDDQAPFIEGIRTLLAWARVNYVFDNKNQWCLYLVFTDTKGAIEKVINSLPTQVTRNFKDIQECIFTVEDVEINFVLEAQLTLIDIKNETKNTVKKNIRLPWNNKVLHQKRFCIAGGAGFIGSHFVKKLLAQGHQVLVLDNLFCSTLDNLKMMADPNLYFVNQDVTCPFSIDGSLDYVIHFASVPSPADYYILPKQTLESGLAATQQLLELSREKEAVFLFSSTSEVYGDPLVHPQTEEYPGNVAFIGPRSQYDQSKRGAETLIKLYFEKYKTDVRIARIFNTYGPGMRLNDGRVVTNFIGALLEDRPLKIYGEGTKTRSFGYVDDTVSGLYQLATIAFGPEENIKDRTFNIGTPVEFSLNELAAKVEELGIKYLNRCPIVMSVRNPNLGDPLIRRPDITKAQKRFGYNPQISLEEGLEKTFLFFWDQIQRG